MPVGGAWSGSPRRQRLGVGFAEPGDRNLARSVLRLRRTGKEITNRKKAPRHENLHGHPPIHTRLPFGITVKKIAVSALRMRGKRTSVFAAAFAFTTESLSADHDFAPVRQLDGLGGALGRSVPAGNGSHGDALPDSRGEIGANGSRPFDGEVLRPFENPGDHFSGVILGLHPKICVGILPFEFRKSAGDVEDLATVILRL